ncbi:hypothetical protein FIBSPDRAFT_229178 [Athelia psychrophila]|uniref:Uncharacterized protein n=1 Tax=Athelia psychrophila TaxID=1759441 RepID=A0A165YR29_9AGAM|nr:hypothetical protein FIBSPDRAFT_229178 [Fibularhizoctonia sp. CBS 109695]
MPAPASSRAASSARWHPSILASSILPHHRRGSSARCIPRFSPTHTALYNSFLNHSVSSLISYLSLGPSGFVSYTCISAPRHLALRPVAVSIYALFPITATLSKVAPRRAIPPCG